MDAEPVYAVVSSYEVRDHAYGVFKTLDEAKECAAKYHKACIIPVFGDNSSADLG